MVWLKKGGASWFSYVPHRSAKGEILTLKIKGLDSSVRYHANGWLAPRGNDCWKAGASYDWVNLDSEPTQEGRDEVLARLETWLSKDLEIEVVDHAAGVRPIIRNSRPVIGFHPDRPQLGFFNGLGSKGTLMAPAVAEHFAMHLCGKCELDEELDFHFTPAFVNRFKTEIITGSLLHRAHVIIKAIIEEGESAIDATIGNGHDTLFLAKCVGNEGKVIGFDIQADAIVSTANRLEEAGVDAKCYDLYQESHANLAARTSENVAVIMFNLGYLPSGDKEVITQVESTMRALKAGLEKIRRGGVLSVMCYPGHTGGDTEAKEVKSWLTALHGDDYGVTLFQREGAKETTPFLLIVSRLL
ncbi:FAD-dependent oxidoreductase [Akkermansiaceae bacterium]|nr:FAD-dependent oxidoreductase [Akkermansiaceae bacterium]